MPIVEMEQQLHVVLSYSSVFFIKERERSLVSLDFRSFRNMINFLEMSKTITVIDMSRN